MNERHKQHTDDAQRLLQRLHEAGSAGITTGELIREGRYGLRPPNRILDLRRQGHNIKTVLALGPKQIRPTGTSVIMVRVHRTGPEIRKF